MTIADEATFDIIFTPDGFRLDIAQGMLGHEALEARAAFGQDRMAALYHLGFEDAASWMGVSLLFLQNICKTFLQCLTRMPELELARERIQVTLEDETAETLLDACPFGLGAEYVDTAWLHMVFGNLEACYRAEIAAWPDSVELYFTERIQQLRVPERVFFHLVENRRDEAFPFAFMATYATHEDSDPEKPVTHLPLRYALTEFRDDQKKLLALLGCLGRAASKSMLISNLMESGELFSALRFTADEAYTFLRETPLYEDAGIYCRVPNWYKAHRSRVRLGISAGEKPPSRVGFDALISTQPTLEVDGIELSRDEVADLLARTEGLAFLKGKWIENDHRRLSELLDRYDEAEGGSLTLIEALRGGNALSETDEEKDLDAGIDNGSWLREVRVRLQHPARIDEPDLPSGLTATLRPYQQTGFAWLNYVTELGFGACLADDMGLGKTVQVLAFAERLHETEPGSHALLVVPASLLGNWQAEIARFTPHMPYQVLHGKPAKTLEEEFSGETFLTITSYALATKLMCVQDRSWALLVLDEAQAIKNPGTKQTRLIKQIDARRRIAMTGTPIENDLSNLWSLFDFLDAGLLGNRREFAAFSKGIAARDGGYARLRRMVGPFILRRLKTDRAIVDDLPSKSEIDLDVALTRKQVILYRKVTDELEQGIQSVTGIARSGLVLTTIMKLKQICNHPSQYLGETAFPKKDSGKFELVEELCETIYAKRERVLVFTQFKEMCGPLDDFLADVFGLRGLVIHGGVKPKQRTELVARFQDEDEYVPYMVLSLKAGGTGLNLTSANHVIHFDRWWNPAVENQATDRVFRIGQRKDVMVYKLTTENTIEQRIAQIIADKSALTDRIIGDTSTSGESWITRLDDEALLDLLRLR